ncbi:putative prolyl 4-hydroxylase alpha subunit [Xylariaceae sp. FL0255]|nr:putative prolyl 4-hydroxylase alpha subunit [Xylariaceae sp. FL0255]
MSPTTEMLKTSKIHYFLVPMIGLLLFLVGPIHNNIPYFINDLVTLGNRHEDLVQHCHIHEPQRQAQIFSRDPLIIYIRNFLNSVEISHLLEISEDKYEPSKVYSSFDGALVDNKMRISESAYADVKDPVVRNITRRAREFQGWRSRSTNVEPLLVQRYKVDGFYNYHFDWDEDRKEGNRVTTFMTYLDSNCTGGGTIFPFLTQPSDDRWCDVIECEEEGRDGYQGVIFKPIAGSAIFWENLHPNGTGHTGTYHAGLPVKSGTKVGLNIWTWDTEWIKPSE